MNQRTLLATCIILAAACLAIATFSWMALNQSRQANQALLAKLEDMSKQDRADSPWAYLNVRVFRGADNGPPVEGVEVTLTGKPYDENEQVLDARTNAEGRCTFGPIQPGSFKIYVNGAVDQTVGYFRYKKCVLVPGEQEETFHYPKNPQTNLGFSVNLPPDLEGECLVFQCDFWIPGPESGSWWQGLVPDRSVYFGQDGEIYERQGGFGHAQGVLMLKKPEPTRRFLSLPAHDIKLHKMMVLRPIEPTKGSWACMPIVEHGSNKPGDWSVIPVTADAVNTWSITLPDNVLSEVRQYLDGPDALNPGKLIRSLRIPESIQVSSHNPRQSDRWYCLFKGTAFCGCGYGQSLWSRTLVKLPEIPSAEAKRKDRKFILAIYASQFRGGKNPKGVRAFDILEPWDPPRPSANKDVGYLPKFPRFAEEPVAAVNPGTGAGWKGFDLTPLVRDQANTGRQLHGLVIRLEREPPVREKGDVSYRFHSSSTTTPYLRPVLLIKKADP